MPKRISIEPQEVGVHPEFLAVLHPEGVLVLGSSEEDSQNQPGRYVALHLSCIHALALYGSEGAQGRLGIKPVPPTSLKPVR